MAKKEFKILGAIIALFAAAVAGVWVHKVLIQVQPFHKLLPLLLTVAAFAVVRLTLLKDISLSGIVRDFFTETSHPLNLAVFRVVLFGYLFFFMPVNQIIFFARLPAELILPPTGMEWFLNHVPVNESFLNMANMGFRIFCLTAAFGFCTRFSALMAALLGVYVLGIPQWFGKVNHHNHLVWFAFVMAGSRAGDYLSVDALVRAVRKPGPIPEASARYALPLKLIWILVGIIYFFPGLWKYYDSGFAWFFADNLKLKLYMNWFWKAGWTPPIMLTDYPVLCRLLGLGTVFFEMSFIALIFLPRLRMVAAAGGLLFHNLTKVFMGIAFYYLQVCYVVFFDWYKIFHRLAGLFFKEDMTVLYDGNCGLCRKTVAVLRSVDLLHQVRYVNVLGPQGEALLEKHHIDRVRALQSMYVVWGHKKTEGFYAYRRMASRYPVFWPILPFLYVWPVPVIGRKIYRRVAESRHCSVRPAASSAEAAPPARTPARANWPLIGIGLLLIIGNGILGFQKNSLAWPLSCYPTFSNTSGDTTSSMWINVVDQNGNEKELTEKRLGKGYAFERYKGLVKHSLKVKDPADRNKRLKALWAIAGQDIEEFKDIKYIRFYSVTYSVLPEKIHQNPLDKKLIYEWSVAP